ncbi:MAG: GNAT family N-acetyltransferase [Bacteroidetes bacterium]|nr:GNAT family N-acetyltransferase [Bacteroidota bacterium]
MLQIYAPSSTTDWDHYYQTRYETLRAPLGFPPGRYEDPTDPEALHLMAWDEALAAPAGVVRGQLLTEHAAQVRYMGVLDNYQGRGVGRLLLNAMENLLQAQGAHTAGLHARDYAVPFYEKCGYTLQYPSGLLIAAIPHFWMTKELV